MGNSCGLLLDEDAREQREMKQYYQTRRTRAHLPQYGPEAIYGPSHAYTVATALPDMAQSKSRSRSRGASISAPHIDGVYSPVVRKRGHSDVPRMTRVPADAMSRTRGASAPQGYRRACPDCARSYDDRLRSNGTISVPRPRQPSATGSRVDYPVDPRSRPRHPSDTRSRARQSSDSRSRIIYPSVPTEAPPNMPMQYILDADFASAGGETPQGAAERRARYRAQQQALSSLGCNVMNAIN